MKPGKKMIYEIILLINGSTFLISSSKPKRFQSFVYFDKAIWILANYYFCALKHMQIILLAERIVITDGNSTQQIVM